MYGVICACGWKGVEANLVRVPRYEGYDEDGELIHIEDYDSCPICKSDELVYEGERDWPQALLRHAEFQD